MFMPKESKNQVFSCVGRALLAKMEYSVEQCLECKNGEKKWSPMEMED